jgi:hypothetical protein
LDRLQFLHSILARLDAASWLVQPDTGWTSHDFEVLHSSWIRLRLTTVAEELEMGKRLFRCRLTSRWSLLARILFGLLAGALLLLIILCARDFPLLWFSLLLLPLLGWFIESESAFHKTLLVSVLNETGKSCNMVSLPADLEPS